MKPNRLASFFFALLSYFTLSPIALAVSPPPDGGYPGGNTAEGQSALLSLTTGTYNTAIGLYSLLSLTDGSFNTIRLNSSEIGMIVTRSFSSTRGVSLVMIVRMTLCSCSTL